MKWITNIEDDFHTNYLLEGAKICYATNLLRDTTKDCWKLVDNTRSHAEVMTMEWNEFLALFKGS